MCHCGAVVKELLERADKPGSTPGDAVFGFFVPFFFLFGLHKLSRHVPPLKQLNFFTVILVDIMTNNTEYTTNCTNLHPTPTSDPLAKVKLAFCTSS